MKLTLLKQLSAEDISGLTQKSIDQKTLDEAGKIIGQVKQFGRESLIQYGNKFGDLGPDGQLVYSAKELHAALGRLPSQQHDLLVRTADRIATFAEAQRNCLQDLSVNIQGGRAGWRFMPVGRAGCYAPGGRYPLPSSILMTAVTARVAGVKEVMVASPRPGDLTLAAAAVGRADFLIAAGGAQAIAGMAFGVEGIPACDVIVGPGNRFVTAAKQLVCGQVGIDMLAGPSELVILADKTANAATIATDLLAQAEHDPDAVPILITTNPHLGSAVNLELKSQLIDLPTADIAEVALQNGGIIETTDLDSAIRICNSIAPEHLEVMVANRDLVFEKLNCYGALFLGEESGEVLGDYGAGPNHVLPTGGTARFSGSLSVQNFLVGRTWLEMDSSPEAKAVIEDSVSLARLEGLEGHARSAQIRLNSL